MSIHKKIGQLSYFYKLKFCISGNPDGKSGTDLGDGKLLGGAGFIFPIAPSTNRYIPIPIKAITHKIPNIVVNIFQPDFGVLPVTFPEYPFI